MANEIAGLTAAILDYEVTLRVLGGQNSNDSKTSISAPDSLQLASFI